MGYVVKMIKTCSGASIDEIRSTHDDVNDAFAELQIVIDEKDCCGSDCQSEAVVEDFDEGEKVCGNCEDPNCKGDCCEQCGYGPYDCTCCGNCGEMEGCCDCYEEEYEEEVEDEEDEGSCDCEDCRNDVEG